MPSSVLESNSINSDEILTSVKYPINQNDTKLFFDEVTRRHGDYAMAGLVGSIKQNNKDDNAIRDLLPMYIRNNTLIYDYNEENTFYGNNEFRHFDIKSLRYFSDRVKNITKDSINYEVFLYPDFKKTFNNY